MFAYFAQIFREMARILTGIQSTGRPHLGNILGAIKPGIVTNGDGEIDLQVPEPSPAVVMDSTEGSGQEDTEKISLD